MTEVSEGRRIASYGLLFLLLFCLVPFDSIGHDLASFSSSAGEYLKAIAATGAPPLKSNLF